MINADNLTPNLLQEELQHPAIWDTWADRDQQQQSNPTTLEQAYKRAVAAPPTHHTMLFEPQWTADTHEQPSRAARAVLRQRNLQNSNGTGSITGDSGSSQELNRLLSDCLAEMGCVPVADCKITSKATLQRGYSQMKPSQQQLPLGSQQQLPPLHQQQLPPGSRAIGVAPPVRSAASSRPYAGVLSPILHQRVTSKVRTSLSNDVVAGRDTADISTTYSQELLQALQQEVEWQAQQLRLKDQQLNEMIQQHELLLRKYLKVKAANEALLQPHAAPARERRRSDNSNSSSPQMHPQHQWTPMNTPRAGMSLLSSAYPIAVQSAAPVEYLSEIISHGGTVPMSPSPPPLSDKSSKPAPRRHQTSNSLQQLGPADAAATDAASTAAAVGTPGRTAFMAVSSLHKNMPEAGSRSVIATTAGAATSSPAVANTASPTTAILDSVLDVSATFIKRPSRSHSQVCLMVPGCGTRPTAAVDSSSSRAADALVSPRVGLRIRSLPACSSAARQSTIATAGVSKLVPVPPTEMPGHIAADSSRAGRLREQSPGSALSCYRPQ